MGKKTIKKVEAIQPFNDASQLVIDHGLTASEERIIEYIVKNGAPKYSFACTEDARSMIVILKKDEYDSEF